jgi:hypothetical protein
MLGQKIESSSVWLRVSQSALFLRLKEEFARPFLKTWLGRLEKIIAPAIVYLLLRQLSTSDDLHILVSRGWFKLGVGFVAFITFQRPLYRIVLKIAKTPTPKIERALGISTVVFPLIGEFLYSPYLEWCRIHAPKFLFL